MPETIVVALVAVLFSPALTLFILRIFFHRRLAPVDQQESHNPDLGWLREEFKEMRQMLERRLGGIDDKLIIIQERQKTLIEKVTALEQRGG